MPIYGISNNITIVYITIVFPSHCLEMNILCFIDIKTFTIIMVNTELLGYWGQYKQFEIQMKLTKIQINYTFFYESYLSELLTPHITGNTNLQMVLYSLCLFFKVLTSFCITMSFMKMEHEHLSKIITRKKQSITRY